MINQSGTHQRRNIVKLLLEFGADPNLADLDGMTPLGWAVDPFVVELLLKHGADPNQRHGHADGRTPLNMVLQNFRGGRSTGIKTRCRIIKMLLDAKADVNICAYNSTKSNLVSALTTRTDYILVEQLFEKRKAELEELGIGVDDGVTLRNVPCSGFRNPIVSVLLRAGAEVCQRELDAAKWTIVRRDIAMAKGYLAYKPVREKYLSRVAEGGMLLLEEL